MFRWLSVAALALAACAQLPPSPQEIDAKRFEPAPGKAVIYMVRELPDISREASSVMLDDDLMGTTYPGTFFRWVVAPGRHRIRGFAGDAGAMVIDVLPDRIYYVQQTYTRGFTGFGQSFFRLVPEPYGRGAILRSELVGGR
ncbi:MAG: lipoprotein [Betaproteobacteria bacterium]|nr:lipoprotein [Betaproteobacteria bacterium]